MGSPWGLSMDWGSVFHPPPKLGQQCKGKENWNLQLSNTDKDINGFVLIQLGAAFEFFAFFWSNSRPLELENSSNYLDNSRQVTIFKKWTTTLSLKQDMF